MSRPRTPTATLEARGAFKRNPQRQRDRANEPHNESPIGEAPGYFTEDQANCWDEILAMASPGVLTAADRGLVELAVRLMDSMRQLTETIVLKDGVTVDVDKAINPAEASAFLRCLSAMGLTPADRSKVSVAKPPAEKSGFDKL